jgi:hypothetical protein
MDEIKSFPEESRDPIPPEAMPSHDPHFKSYNSSSEDRGTAYTVVISTSLNNIPPLYYTISYTSLNYLPPIYIQKSLSKWGKTDNTGKKELTIWNCEI